MASKLAKVKFLFRKPKVVKASTQNVPPPVGTRTRVATSKADPKKMMVYEKKTKPRKILVEASEQTQTRK